ncbi:hypothetical protein REPUB_Repub06bG0118700 [Reevesia pubescens]
MFRKGGRELLCNIRRGKAWSNKKQTTATIQVSPQEYSEEDRRSSSTSSSSGYNSLVDENKRLRKANRVLSSELTSMKRKCKDLLDLVAKYAQFETKKEDDDHDHESPKLFGVKLEVEGERQRKRRAEIISESASILLSQSCK